MLALFNYVPCVFALFGYMVRCRDTSDGTLRKLSAHSPPLLMISSAKTYEEECICDVHRDLKYNLYSSIHNYNCNIEFCFYKIDKNNVTALLIIYGRHILIFNPFKSRMLNIHGLKNTSAHTPYVRKPNHKCFKLEIDKGRRGVR